MKINITFKFKLLATIAIGSIFTIYAVINTFLRKAQIEQEIADGLESYLFKIYVYNSIFAGLLFTLLVFVIISAVSIVLRLLPTKENEKAEQKGPHE